MIDFIDGFDHLRLTDIARKWGTNNHAWIDTTRQRTGEGCLGMSVGESGVLRSISSGPPWPITDWSSVVMGFAIRFFGALTSAYICDVHQWVEVDEVWISRKLASLTYHGGIIKVWGGTYSMPNHYIGEFSQTLDGVWRYLEWKTTFDDGDHAEVWIDGVKKFDVGAPTGMMVGWMHGHCLSGLSAQTYYDDFYIINPSIGGYWNDNLGPISIRTFLPNLNGDHNDFSAYPGVLDNYEHVNEARPDDDVSYVNKTETGSRLRECYEYPSVDSEDGGIIAVQQSTCEKYSAEMKVRHHHENVGLHDWPSADIDAPDYDNTSYKINTFIWQKNPDDNEEWTHNAFNASQFGRAIGPNP